MGGRKSLHLLILPPTVAYNDEDEAYNNNTSAENK
jgi:hypothetical protein